MANYGTIGRNFTGHGLVKLGIGGNLPVKPFSSFICLVNSNSHKPHHISNIASSPITFLRLDNAGIRYKIVEVVTRSKMPIVAPVLVVDRQLQQVLLVVNSEANGVVTVNGLDPERLYTLIALDPDNVYNADVLDLKKPTL